MIDPYYSHGGIEIYHGDAREVLPQLYMDRFKSPEPITLPVAAMIFTDPPYGNKNQGGKDLASARAGQCKGGRAKAAEPIANDGPEATEMLVDVLNYAVSRFMDSGTVAVCSGGGGPNPVFADWILRIGGKLPECFTLKDIRENKTPFLTFQHAVIWDKTRRGPGMGWQYRRDYEFVLLFEDGDRLTWHREGQAVSNIVRFRPINGGINHPNEKPVQLPQHFIENHSRPGDLILDPFAGSGTTGVAAKALGRRAILIELEERFCEVSAERLAQEVMIL